MLGKEFWRNIDLRKKQLPEDIILKKDSVTITEGIKTIDDAKVFYREALPVSGSTSKKLSVFFMHGRAFSSKTWLDLGTIHILSALGFRIVAIDIPGYGNSPATEMPDDRAAFLQHVMPDDRAAFLQHVIEAFGLNHPVIVSPSLSGFYSIPYLLKHWKSMAGYVPVAPIGYDLLEKLPACTNPEIKKEIYVPLQEFLYDPIPDLSHIQTPTMVVFGEKDRTRSSALLSLLPVSQCQEIPNGKHPAYLDDPDLWHKLLYNFLTALEKTYCLEA